MASREDIVAALEHMIRTGRRIYMPEAAGIFTHCRRRPGRDHIFRLWANDLAHVNPCSLMIMCDTCGRVRGLSFDDIITGEMEHAAKQMDG